jgi:hypothetical protein
MVATSYPTRKPDGLVEAYWGRGVEQNHCARSAQGKPSPATGLTRVEDVLKKPRVEDVAGDGTYQALW